MKLAEIDRKGKTWTYRPARHKSQHHGKSRTILIGPKARALIQKFIADGTVADSTAPLFSPRRAREEMYAIMRAKRKTRVQPSQASRRKNDAPKLATAYSVNAYALAIRRAAERAGLEHWHPNQLRHLFASEVRRGYGLEAAQVLLGHARADVTQTYAERDVRLATSVAAKIG